MENKEINKEISDRVAIAIIMGFKFYKHESLGTILSKIGNGKNWYDCTIVMPFADMLKSNDEFLLNLFNYKNNSKCNTYEEALDYFNEKVMQDSNSPYWNIAIEKLGNFEKAKQMFLTRCQIACENEIPKEYRSSLESLLQAEQQNGLSQAEQQNG